ncbi:glycosyltransferase family 2 protein [Ktedonobacter sp. SOSP1-52]|uniref:glycosyltransferase family 2 protein n=1 Tax=Ktedonobacter sp. SOSP1-52 TaxID=2778366 RepID=UPI0019151F32|nr:glycosyltransferase family 2 protein [Ktedonobacter sp. SOSP1-52]
MNILAMVGDGLGYCMFALISLINIRFISYFYSFFVHWPRYRRREKVTTSDLQRLPLPYIKIQITTRGSAGSTEVIRRGIKYVMRLAYEDPTFYGHYLNIEVVTESEEQKQLFEREFVDTPIPVYVVVLPKNYETRGGTQLKARGLHYMVEMRRRGLNRKHGRTVIVHYDEESVMEPLELRRLFRHLALTDKKLTEGPIYYPLEYRDASVICRAMEANRPIGCFECRDVMEKGIPLHLHGSNLVIDEDLENELGWDIGNLDGQPFIAEDYVFGVNAYLQYGSSIFGWHGSVMLEQPPFSFKSAFRQRFRWIIGVLQGMEMMKRTPMFSQLPKGLRFRLTWGTRYRITTFALGLPAGAISLLYLMYQYAQFFLRHQATPPMPLPVMLWMIFAGFLWLNSIFIGAWYNISTIMHLPANQGIAEMAKVIAIAPIAGVLESSAAFWAIFQWICGNRKVSWKPTPKTAEADKVSITAGGGQ